MDDTCGDKARGAKILVIDGSRDCADSLCMLVEALGGSATAAYSGSEGVDSLVRIKPDVAIIELALPDMTGVELAKRMRALESGTKLIATDGGHWKSLELLTSVFDGLLLKPISVEAIEQLIRERRGVTRG